MTYTFAIEASTATTSIALLGNSKLLEESSWQVKRGDSQSLFAAIDDMLKKNGITLNDVNLFGVGLGPGNFTGLRTSLSAIQALALPTHTDVIGISSAEAIAYRIRKSEDGSRGSEVVGLESETRNITPSEQKQPTKNPQCEAQPVRSVTTLQARLAGSRSEGDSNERSEWQQPSTKHQSPSRILIVGDARRRRLWLGIFEPNQNSLTQIGKFELVPTDDFSKKIIPSDTIATPDWTTLGDDLLEIVPDSATLIKAAQIPTATNIARLALRHQINNIDSEPLKPIYMHPPVFIEPRFTEATKLRF